MNREVQELREVITKLVPLLTGKGLRVTQQGSQAYVRANAKTNKPEVVNIPSIPDNASSDFIAAVAGFVDHEVAHVLFTEWEHYGGDGKKVKKFSPEGQALMMMHNIIEDTMIEREIVKVFPGSQSNLDRLHHHFVEKITTPAVKAAKTPMEAFNYLIVPMMRALSGQSIFQDFMDAGDHWKHPLIEGLYKQLSPTCLQSIAKSTTTRQTLVAAQEIHDILFQEQKKAEEEKKRKKEEEQKKKEEEQKKKEEEQKKKEEEQKEAEKQPGQEGEPEEKQEDKTDESEPEADEKAEEQDDAGAPKQGESEEQEEGEEQGKQEKSEDAGDEAGEDAEQTGEKADEEAEESKEAGAGDGEEDRDHEEEQEGEQDGKRAGNADGSTEEESDEEEGDGPGAGSEADSEDDAENTKGKSKQKSDEEADEQDEADDGSADGSESDEGEAQDKAGKDDADEGEEGSGQSGDPERDDNDDIVGNQTGGFDQVADNESDGEGAGGEAGKTMFDIDTSEFKPLDLSNAMAEQIEEMARSAHSASHYSVFTKDHDRIETFVVPEGGMRDDWVPKIDDEVGRLIGPMQKDIERMMASQSLSVRTAGHRSGRLHSASLHRVLMGDGRVFQRKEEHKAKETAVTLLVDNSGSMHGARLATAMKSAYALGQTLERVGISCEILGFTTGELPRDAYNQAYDEYRKGIHYDRTSTIVMPIYKAFNERMSPTVKARIAFQINMQAGLNTNTDGESLEYAAMRLIPRKEKRKVMLVLSDGQPVGSNSGWHLRETVKKLTKGGIECVGIGINSNAVRSFYDRHMVLNNVADLPAAVMGELRRILTN